MNRRVAITGLGVISPLGCHIESFWQNLVHGRSGVDRISRYDPSGLPVHIAAEVRDFNLKEHTDAHPLYLDGASITADKLDRRTQYALAATAQAVRDAQLDGAGAGMWADADLYFGTGEGDNDLNLLAKLFMPHSSLADGCDTAALLSESLARDFAVHDQLMEVTVPASLIAAHLGIQGEVTACLTACAASAQAIGEAMRRIQSGECALALAGGAHAMTSPLDVLGFAMLSALSTRNDEPARASRPFDRARNGFVLGEGAGVLVLEDFDAARQRGARIHAELIGYGTTSDAYRVTDMHVEARGATAAIIAALESASLTPAEIGYVNAHGTSTLENDRAETLALHRALGDEAPRIPVSSTKSMTGHAVAAAGALELIATVLALRAQILPPTINLEIPDPECDLDYVPNRARAHEFSVALSNSFGFGGQNVALIVRRAQ
jgi:3-oxoacyl-[acyl-carrier-protein] synthase II